MVAVGLLAGRVRGRWGGDEVVGDGQSVENVDKEMSE